MDRTDFVRNPERFLSWVAGRVNRAYQAAATPANKFGAFQLGSPPSDPNAQVQYAQKVAIAAQELRSGLGD